MVKIEYGQILKRSKLLTLKNKWLWVYGLVLAAVGGGSSGSGSSSSSSSRNKTIQNLPSAVPEKTKEVLGTATTAIQAWLISVPIWAWVLIGIAVLVLILISIAFSMFVSNWAKGALIAGLDDADGDKPVNIFTTSPRGISSVKSLIIYGLLVAGVVAGLVLSLTLIIGLGFAAFSQIVVARIIWTVLAVVVGIVAFGVVILATGFASVYADRLIVLHGLGPGDAFKKGFGLAKGNFLPTLILGIINGAIGCGVGCAGSLISIIVLGIPAAAIIIPAFIEGFHMPSPVALAVLGLLVILFININLLVRSGLLVFNYSNWNIFVKEILKQEKKV
jgi:hypothetical protein